MARDNYLQDDDSGGNVSGAMGLSEHTLTRVMAGDAESVRQRLIVALEEMGWRVLNENPLRAKHGARGGAEYYMSANALEYPTTLDIGFKQQGHGATRVTFDYCVVHGYFTKGDRQTLTREAEAIMALAALRATQSNCAVCGAETGNDSRFCRKCGAPAAAAEPAELEVLRLTAGTRAGYQWSVIGAIMLAVAFALTVIAIFVDQPKAVKVLTIIGLINGLLGWWSLLAGLRRSHLTLNPPGQREEQGRYVARHRVPVTPRTNELPEAPAEAPERLSITEGTTDLLASQPEREPVPASRRQKIKPE
ncbi:MAG TPA: hypothetical protein VFD58_16150 [Blastocatellia bacterium]|nr:hypothetical protein [Blastocatellia bacterium]